MRENDFGFKQGSILGTSLFTIFTNGIENAVEKCEIVLYANDTLLFTDCTTCEKCYEKIEKDMDNINRWLKINNLKLNENKTLMVTVIKFKKDLYNLFKQVFQHTLIILYIFTFYFYY